MDVTIAASENVLSDPGGGLTSELTDQTGPDGFVEFEYNPPAGDFFEQIDFAATSTVTGEEVACSGAVMVGTAPRLGGSGAVASFQRALAGLVPGIDGRGDHSEAYLSYRAEITQILLDHPDALREFRGRLNQHRSLLRALGEGRGARISQDQYQALLKAINFLKKNANYPLLSALEELQDFITFPGHLALYGIEITEATDGERAAREPAAAVKPRLLRRAGGHTPSFEANLGQFAEEVLYSGRAAGYSLHLKRDGAVITASPVSQLGVTKSAEVGLRLVGSSAKAEVRTSRKKPATSHYILGADSDQWISGVPHFGEVRYGKVYPGVDLVFYGRPGRFEYDFIVAPGADPDPIAMAFDGVSDFRKDDSGALLGRTRAGEFRLEPPVVYQIVEGEKHLIAGADIADHEQAEISRAVQFELPEILGKDTPILYIEMDGTGVPVTGAETAGRKGKAGGTARTREVKLGCVFTQTSCDDNGRALRDEDSTSYTGAIEDAAAFGRRIWSEALRRGWRRARKKVVIGDGASWIWNLSHEYFPARSRSSTSITPANTCGGWRRNCFRGTKSVAAVGRGG